MKLSIITPCSRPNNLPIIYDSIIHNKEIFTRGIEWIIVYDSEEVDERILSYVDTKKIDIKLHTYKREKDDPYASYMRNIGIIHASGDYIYYLDDDNIIHPNLYEVILGYGERNKLLIFNQFDVNLKRARHRSIFDRDSIKPGGIDTAQIVVPKSFKKTKWINGGKYNDETPYILELLKDYGEESLKWVNLLCSYRNFLRRDK